MHNCTGEEEPEPEDPPSTPHQFEGDYFGDYAAEHFDDYDNYMGPDDPDDDNDLIPGASQLASHVEHSDDDSTEAEDAENFEDEAAWEAPPPSRTPPLRPVSPAAEESAHPSDEDDNPRQGRVHEQLRRSTYVVRFPSPLAGAPISVDRTCSEYETFKRLSDSNNANPYAPFISEVDWKFARWAKMRGPGSTAVTELLSIEEIPRLLGLSYNTAAQLNAIIDNQLSSGRPRFIRREIVIAGEAFEVFYRDIIACVRALFGDPEFSGILVFSPERHYADADHTIRVYFDMHTGKWWWAQQKEMERRNPGATIIPIIISSDKTQLTLFGSKTAYPVYMTIGNLPKDVRRKPSRRGQILLAYLPTSNLAHITNKAARRRALANLYHTSLRRILKPLREAGVHGISLASGDGILRRGHPIFAVHIGDYLEQVLVTGCKMGECPKCPIPSGEIGEATDCDRPLRDFNKVLAALKTVNQGPRAFSRACKEAGIKRIQQPYWADLPFVNIYCSITPDVLHQLCQGVVKHVVAWIIAAYGADEIDARCRRFPPNHNVRLFLKGITKLQRVTGKEHADMCRFILGLIIGIPLPEGASRVQLIRCVRALLDFLYLAQYPAHTTDTLELLRDALRRFHHNKVVFVHLGIRIHFKFPKLHSLDHYLTSIELFGTTDNYDTQYTERLHIDFAKDAYRATNRKDKFPQMTLWLERREKILRHEAYRSPSRTLDDIASRVKMTRLPSVKAVSFDDAAARYGALYLRDALARFVIQYRDPLEQRSLGVYLRFRTVPVFHKVRFILEDAQELGIMEDMHDVAHARPERRDRQGRPVPGRFDTVLVREDTPDLTGMQRYRIGRLQMVFKLPKKASDALFPMLIAPGHLAYVEWFTAFTQPDNVHGLYRVSRCRGPAGERLASVIEVSKLRRSCHLFPDFGVCAPRNWTSSTVLDQCDNFFLNHYSDQHMYMTLQ
ncbi:hypothetical protein OH77DRAFT_1503949 [Trametes cingulata]|nr:hypothetical protein OH77DRAFT_1503949 [Trametes cingulata]